MEKLENLNGYTGFLLQKLTLKQSTLFGDDFELVFFDPKDLHKSRFLESPYTTLIIGPNGTGKSLVLKIITDIILDLNNYKQAGAEGASNVRRLNNDYYYLSYFINGDYYEVRNYDEDVPQKSKRKRFDLQLWKNSMPTSIEYFELPERLLACSLLLTDRFNVFREPPAFYKYLGVRSLNSPSTARTRNYVRRTVEHVVNAFAVENVEIIGKIKELLAFLNFKPIFLIYYFPKYKEKFFTGHLTRDEFNFLFDNYNDPVKGFSKREKSEYLPFGVTYFKNTLRENPSLTEEIVAFLNEIKNSGELKKEEGSRSEYFEYDVLNRELSLDKFKLLNHLAALDLITFPSISLKKNNNYVDIEQASSGEYHFISTMIAIYASLSPNSLVLIDEPEISLHPNWQIGYISFLKRVFEEFFNCHFIIATHSHFFASDLNGKSSMIIALTNGRSSVEKVDLIKNDTFGWSADSVLYNVFKVKTTRNHFVEMDVMKLVDLLENKSSNTAAIEALINKFEALNLLEADPLVELIQEAKSYIANDFPSQ